LESVLFGTHKRRSINEPLTNCKEWRYYPYFPATYPIYS
jgi:hypothetical protein